MTWFSNGTVRAMVCPKSMETQLRSILLDDLDELASLYVECFNSPPWNDGWSHESARDRLDDIFASRHFRGYVALFEHRIVGMLMGHKERWIRQHHFNLQEMCVRPPLQRSGIGTALLRHAAEHLNAEGVERVYLLTLGGSLAETFYQKSGFYKSRGRIVMGRALRTD